MLHRSESELNIHMDQPDLGKLTSLHFYAWSKGLKTGMYVHWRTHAAADAIKFTVDTFFLNKVIDMHVGYFTDEEPIGCQLWSSLCAAADFLTAGVLWLFGFFLLL